MFASFQGLPKYVLLDANVMLNGSFILDSLNRKAIEAARNLGFTLIIDGCVYKEAVNVLRQCQFVQGLRFDPVSYLDRFINLYSILLLPSAPIQDLPFVNSADHHVVSAARHYDAWILTSDAKLILQCQSAQIPARSAWSTYLDWKSKHDMELRDMIRIGPLSLSRGLVFSRVRTGNWSGRVSSGRFSVFDVENIGNLFFDVEQSSWSFDSPTVQLRINCAITEPGEWVVAISYWFRSDSDGTFSLRVGQPGKESLRISQNVSSKLPGTGPGEMRVGSTRRGGNYWNGHIGIISGSSNPIRRHRDWLAFLNVDGAAPDPFEGDALSWALNIMNSSDERSLASAFELNQLWMP